MRSYIYIEPSGEGIDSTTKQIASRIRNFSADVRGCITGISIGNHLDGKESQLIGLIDELITIEVPLGGESNTETISKILNDVVSEGGLGILYFGFTHQGMELGPAVGWRLRIPVITNCVSLDWTDDCLCVTRQIHGGKLLVFLTVDYKRGAVITVQKGAWKNEGVSDLGESPISLKPLSWRDSWAAEKTEVIGIIGESLEGEEDITKAEILVSVGRGLGGTENLLIMRELGDKLEGMVSCSRPVVDLGWLPASRQVDISGKTVAPVIYLALGISGQANHLAGMDASRLIIAVNKDPSAPIFNTAHYGVVDDIMKFVPELLEQIKRKQISGGK